MKKSNFVLRLAASVLLCAVLIFTFSGCILYGYSGTTRIGAAMWVVEDDAGNRIYLMGSVHIGTEDMYPFCDEIEDAFSSCDYLAVEYDVIAAEKAFEAADDATKAAYYAQFLYKDGTKITDHLKTETYNAAVEYLTQKGLYTPELDNYNAVYWESMLNQLLTEDTGYKFTDGVDRYLINSAYTKGITVLDIESEQSQLELLLSAADEVSEASITALMSVSKTPLLMKNQYRTILKYYNRGDMNTMNVLLSSEVQEGVYDKATEEAMKEYNLKMYDERNGNMAKTAAQYLTEGKKVFFVVGLAHMLGDNGIIAKLTSEGYLVYRK